MRTSNKILAFFFLSVLSRPPFSFSFTDNLTMEKLKKHYGSDYFLGDDKRFKDIHHELDIWHKSTKLTSKLNEVKKHFFDLCFIYWFDIWICYVGVSLRPGAQRLSPAVK